MPHWFRKLSTVGPNGRGPYVTASIHRKWKEKSILVKLDHKSIRGKMKVSRVSEMRASDKAAIEEFGIASDSVFLPHWPGRGLACLLQFFWLRHDVLAWRRGGL